MVPTKQGTSQRNVGGMVLTIYVDTREKPRAIQRILAHFEKEGIEVVHRKLDEGDYKLDPDGL